MKYLKKYEKKSKVPNFNVGDNVICIDNEGSILIEGMEYLVKKVYPDKDGNYVCKVQSKMKTLGESLGVFSCRRFKADYEENMERYNV